MGFKFTPTRTVGTAAPRTTAQTTRRIFEGERPTLELPKRDPRRVAQLRQQVATPGIRKLRTALSRALVRSYENPNVARMVTRSALSGFGEGLEQIMGGAARTAEAQAATERGILTQEALANYQAAMQQFMGEARTVTTTGSGAAIKTPAEKEQAFRERQLRTRRAQTGGRLL